MAFVCSEKLQKNFSLFHLLQESFVIINDSVTSNTLRTDEFQCTFKFK